MKNIEELENTRFWEEIESQLKNIRTDVIEYYPIPKTIELSKDFLDSISPINGKILLLRAEALYLTGAQRFVKAAAPMAMSGALELYMEQNNLYALYDGTVYFSSPPQLFDTSYTDKNIIIVQMILIDSKTREILWYGQAETPDVYDRNGVTAETADFCGKQIPNRFLR